MNGTQGAETVPPGSIPEKELPPAYTAIGQQQPQQQQFVQPQQQQLVQQQQQFVHPQQQQFVQQQQQQQFVHPQQQQFVQQQQVMQPQQQQFVQQQPYGQPQTYVPHGTQPNYGYAAPPAPVAATTTTTVVVAGGATQPAPAPRTAVALNPYKPKFKDNMLVNVIICLFFPPWIIIWIIMCALDI